MGLWKIAQIANVGIMRDALQLIFQLHEAFSTTTLRTANENINCYHDSCELFASSTWLLLSRSQDASICIQNFEHETTSRLFKPSPGKKETSIFCMTAFAMFSAPWCSEPGRRSKTSTPKEWVARRGSRVAMLRLASWARMEKNSTPQRKVLLFAWFCWQGMLLVFFLLFFFWCGWAGGIVSSHQKFWPFGDRKRFRVLLLLGRCPTKKLSSKNKWGTVHRFQDVWPFDPELLEKMKVSPIWSTEH